LTKARGRVVNWGFIFTTVCAQTLHTPQQILLLALLRKIIPPLSHLHWRRDTSRSTGIEDRCVELLYAQVPLPSRRPAPPTASRTRLHFLTTILAPNFQHPTSTPPRPTKTREPKQKGKRQAGLNNSPPRSNKMVYRYVRRGKKERLVGALALLPRRLCLLTLGRSRQDGRGARQCPLELFTLTRAEDDGFEQLVFVRQGRVVGCELGDLAFEFFCILSVMILPFHPM
jgi:hypothetical protein